MGARGQSSREVGSYTRRQGPVAQLVEQGTFNPKVTGSIPVRPNAGSPREGGFPVVRLGFGRGRVATQVATRHSLRNCRARGSGAWLSGSTTMSRRIPRHLRT